MEEGNKKAEELRKKIEKVMDYPLGKKFVYLANYAAESMSAEERMKNMEFKLSILMAGRPPQA